MRVAILRTGIRVAISGGAPGLAHLRALAAILAGASAALVTVALLAPPARAARAPRDPGRSTAEAVQPLVVPGLDSLAAATLGTALDYLNLRPEELGFDKLYADDDTFRLAIVEEILNDPLKTPGWQEESLARIREAHASPPRLAALLGTLMEAPPAGSRRAAGGDADLASGSVEAEPPSLVAEMDSAVVAFLAGCREAESALERAFAGLTEEDRARVLMLAPAFWGDSENPPDRLRKGALHREVGAAVDTTLKWTEDPILDAAVKLDRRALTESAVLFLEALERLEETSTALLRDTNRIAEFGEAWHSGVAGSLLHAYETPWGLFVLGGPGNNEYTAEALRGIAFVIDPGGDDVYRGRAASAAGGLARPLSFVLDLAGNDLYEAARAEDGTPRTYALGGALFGLAALIDRAGDDVYRADDGSLGAGFFGGGFLFDGGGRDLFEGRNLCEGSGAFGLGALVSGATVEAPPGPELETDRGFDLGMVKVPGTGARPIRWDDNDTYICARQSQGFASTFGFGLLYDRVGNDAYRSGAYTLHRPLLPNDFQSLSQGFSIGFRPRAGGGIGVLLDEEGNDFYDAEVYAQGTSYWYSIGLLADFGGNDRYLATQYAQGAGVHLAVGSLYDRGGDDHYVCKLGVTQGTAHDLSVGWQIDESGNDFYIVSDGQGMSITNSAAVFIDAQGDDVYATPGVGQGWLTWARGFCGAGIFLDLEGKDAYPRRSGAAEGYGENGATWSTDIYAIGIDLPRDLTLPSEVVPEPVLTAADSAMSLEQLFEISNIWEVGSAREKVRRARKALIARGLDAVRFCLREGLDSQDGLVYRNLLEIGKAYPDTFAALLLPRLRDVDPWVQRNTISLLGELKRKEARAPLEAMLREPKQEKHHNRVIQALGNIGERAAIPAVRPFLRDAKERRRIVTVVALAALRDTTSVPAFAGLLGDPALTVRSAASAALVAFPIEAVRTLAGGREGAPARTEAPQHTSGGSPARIDGPSRASGGPSGRIDETLRVRTIGKIAVALKDSIAAPQVAARGTARRELMRVLEVAGTPLPDPSPGAARESAAVPDASVEAAAARSAAVRAAAVEALLTLGDAETAGFVRLQMKDETDPLVKRAFERGSRDRERGD